MKTDTIIRKVAGRTFTVDLPASPDSKYGMLASTADLARAELAIAATLALEGPVAPESFRFIRGALGIPAKELAAKLGVAAETISRWENGARDVDLGAWLALGAIALERAGRPTVTEERMTKIAEGFKPPKERRVDL